MVGGVLGGGHKRRVTANSMVDQRGGGVVMERWLGSKKKNFGGERMWNAQIHAGGKKRSHITSVGKGEKEKMVTIILYTQRERN